MKKIFLLFVTLMVSGQLCLAQDEAQEAEKEIKNVSAFIQQKNYLDAINSLDNAKKLVIKLLSGQIAVALPAKVGDWVYTEKSQRMIRSISPQSTINVSKTYVVEKEGAKGESKEDIGTDAVNPLPEGMMARLYNSVMQSTVSITITDDFSQSMEVSRSHSNQDMVGFGMIGGQISEPIKVKGYRALLKYMDENKQGSLTIIVGAALVRIEGLNVDNKDLLRKFADAVDFKLIKAILGE